VYRYKNLSNLLGLTEVFQKQKVGVFHISLREKNEDKAILDMSVFFNFLRCRVVGLRVVPYKTETDRVVICRASIDVCHTKINMQRSCLRDNDATTTVMLMTTMMMMMMMMSVMSETRLLASAACPPVCFRRKSNYPTNRSSLAVIVCFN